MIIDLEANEAFVAGDETVLREILHPHRMELEIRYSLAHSTLEPGHTSKPHRLESTEVYFILEGTGEMHIDDEIASVSPGYTVYIPPRSIQYIINTGDTDLKFLCIVDPAWQAEDEEIL